MYAENHYLATLHLEQHAALSTGPITASPRGTPYEDDEPARRQELLARFAADDTPTIAQDPLSRHAAISAPQRIDGRRRVAASRSVVSYASPA